MNRSDAIAALKQSKVTVEPSVEYKPLRTYLSKMSYGSGIEYQCAKGERIDKIKVRKRCKSYGDMGHWFRGNDKFSLGS